MSGLASAPRGWDAISVEERKSIDEAIIADENNPEDVTDVSLNNV